MWVEAAARDALQGCGMVGMCVVWDCLGRGALFFILCLSPPSLSLSLLSTPLLAKTALQSFRYDAAGGGVHQWNNLWFCWCLKTRKYGAAP
jgi:hypothetical protein